MVEGGSIHAKRHLGDRPSDHVIYDFLVERSEYTGLHVLFFTRDTRFKEDARRHRYSSEMNSRIRIIVLQEYADVAPEVVTIGHSSTDRINRVVQKILARAFFPATA